MARDVVKEKIKVADCTFKLSREEREELLRKSWMTHDGLWFFSALGELGIDKTNDMNKSAVRQVGRIEMHRFMKAVGVEKVRSAGQVLALFLAAFDLYCPRFISMRMETGKDGIDVSVKKCFAAEAIKNSGLGDSYLCGIAERLTGWSEAMGVSYEIEPEVGLCPMARGKECRYSFRVLLEGSKALAFPNAVLDWP